MAKGSPSMIALLGLLAVAGYQNRDKLTSLLKGPGSQASGDTARAPFDAADAGAASGGGMLDQFGDMLRGAGAGGLVGGLSDLIGRFTNPVQSAKANTWVNSGPNTPLDDGDLDAVLDEETVNDLMEKTGLSRADLMERLRSILPEAVDSLTPKGRLPTVDEARALI